MGKYDAIKRKLNDIMLSQGKIEAVLSVIKTENMTY